MKTQSRRTGFSIVEIVVVAAVLAIIGLLGYTVYKNNANKTASTGTSQTTQAATATDVKPASAIKTTADLKAAASTLDQTDPSGSNNTDASQLDSQLSAF